MVRLPRVGQQADSGGELIVGATWWAPDDITEPLKTPHDVMYDLSSGRRLIRRPYVAVLSGPALRVRASGPKTGAGLGSAPAVHLLYGPQQAERSRWRPTWREDLPVVGVPRPDRRGLHLFGAAGPPRPGTPSVAGTTA